MSVYKTLRAIDFLHRPAVKFSRFRFRGTEPKTLLYVGHSSLASYDAIKVRNFSEINTLHGANFLFQTTDYPDYPDIFCQQATSKIRGHPCNSWESIKPTNGLSLNLFYAHKSHKSTRIIYALRLCCHPDGSLNSKH